MDGGSDCHSSNGTIWSRLTRFFGREDDESLEKAIIEARADGEVEPDEESMLLGILRFNDLQVQDTMTPRTDIDCVPEDMLLPEVARVIVESGHSRIPVFRDTRDNMVGMLHAKDILSCLLDPKMADQPASAIMREPFFVPETKPIRNLLQEFRASKQHIAIALDEYGGTSGILTMDDILEEIVGNISDEFDEEETPYTQKDATHFLFEGHISLKDFYRAMDFDDRQEETFEAAKGEADSLAGFLLELSGAFPKRGQEIRFGRYAFTVESIDRKRIRQISLTLLPEAQVEEQD